MFKICRSEDIGRRSNAVCVVRGNDRMISELWLFATMDVSQ